MYACTSVAILLFLLSLLFFRRFQAACPPGWLTWQDSCYILLPDKMTWAEAALACDRPRSDMIVPNSQQENDFIWLDLGAQKEIWIGCRDFAKTETNMCKDSKPNVTFTNWKEGEPSDLEDECVRMMKDRDGKWGDSSCREDNLAACEMRVPHPMYCLTADANGRFTSQCLLNHDIKNLTAKGVIGCTQACWAEPRCHSFNLWQQGKICQLNNASHLQADVNDFKVAKGCSFFEL